MHERIDVNNLLLAALFSALGVAIPLLFHLVGMGSVFLPMYIPLAIGAFMLGRGNAAMAGFFTPLASAVLTGMPPFYPPVAAIMMVQLCAFCFTISFLSHRAGAGLFAALAAAVLVDRALLALLNFLVLPSLSLSPVLVTAYDMLKALPGIILLFLVVPAAVPQCIKIIGRHSLRPYGHGRGGEHEH
jgi:hypothetical protein